VALEFPPLLPIRNVREDPRTRFRFPAQVSSPEVSVLSSKSSKEAVYPVHASAITDEVQQLCGVSERLDLLAALYPLVAEAVITISRNVRNTAALLEVLIAAKTAPISGLAAEQHRTDNPQPATAVASEHKAIGYGMPCSNCHAYYTADLKTCPICKSSERVSPTAVPPLPVVPTIPAPKPTVAKLLTESATA